MLFSAAVFLFLFLPMLLVLYFLSPRGLRNLLLLTASLLFYMWGAKHSAEYVVLPTSIALNYTMGLVLDRLQTPRLRRRMIAVTVAANLGLLAVFKYGVFLIENLNLTLAAVHLAPVTVPKIYLPLGISFFTFHALSYVIDVYRGEVRALKNPITFALYISFFPQSIAGPIVRYSDLAAQLVKRTVRREGFAEGVRRFIFGLSKKMLIANTLAVPADAIFGLPGEALTAGLSWLGIVCYTLQIYFDFSGYSDMAIGLAKMFGFDFKENFNYPYVSRSITEFWRRWHLSLSSWFRDYLYIPLGGNRRGTARTYFNLVTVFFLCGLWHGASWAFVCWGLYHGGFLVLERMVGPASRAGREERRSARGAYRAGREERRSARGAYHWLDAAWAPARHAYALAVVMVGWVFFRATTFTQAAAFLTAMAGLGAGTGVEFTPAVYLHADVVLALIAGVIASAPVLPWLRRLRPSDLAIDLRLPRLSRVLEVVFAGASVTVQAGLLLASAMMLAAGTYNPFIYFRF